MHLWIRVESARKTFVASMTQVCPQISPNMMQNEFWLLYTPKETLSNILGGTFFLQGYAKVIYLEAKIFKILACSFSFMYCLFISHAISFDHSYISGGVCNLSCLCIHHKPQSDQDWNIGYIE